MRPHGRPTNVNNNKAMCLTQFLNLRGFITKGLWKEMHVCELCLLMGISTYSCENTPQTPKQQIMGL